MLVMDKAGNRPWQRGISVLEVGISAALFSIITVVMISLINMTIQASQTSVNVLGTDLKVSRVVDVISDELRDASLASISTPGPGEQSSQIDYQRALGFDESVEPPELILSEFVSLLLEGRNGEILGNGQDDNKNGLVDEGSLIRQIGSSKAVLADNVTNLNFTRSPQTPVLTVAVEISYIDALNRDPKTNEPTLQAVQISRNLLLQNP